MLILGESGALSFKGINITKFLKRYKELSVNFSLSKLKVIVGLHRYMISQR